MTATPVRPPPRPTDGEPTDGTSGARSSSSPIDFRPGLAGWLLGPGSSVLLVVGIALATAFVVRTAHSNAAAAEANAGRETEPVPVVLQRVSMASAYTLERRHTGLIEAGTSAELGFETAGRVEAAPVTIGQRLVAGAVIGRLATRRNAARLDEALADVDRAAADVELRRLEATRARELLDRGAGNRAERDRTRAAALGAEAELAGLRARAVTLRADLDDATLRAPFAGVVTSRDFDVGDVVAAGTPVARLVDQDSFEARIGVPLAVAADTRAGDPVRLELRGRTLDARVRAIVPRVDAGSRTVLLVVALPPDAGAMEGESVTLGVTREVPREGVWVPLGALVSDVKGLFAVQVVAPDDALGRRIVRAPVQVIHTDGARAYVSGTLADGDEVVVRGTNRVFPGQAVTSASAEGAPVGTARGAARPPGSLR